MILHQDAILSILNTMLNLIMVLEKQMKIFSVKALSLVMIFQKLKLLFQLMLISYATGYFLRSFLLILVKQESPKMDGCQSIFRRR